MASLGALCAMEIVLSRFLSVSAWNIKVGFAFVPLAVAAFLYGPAAGALVGGLSDFLGAVLFPIGPYFPGFTLTAALTGIVFGICFHKRQTSLRILAAVLINQLILGFIINSFWISYLYGSPLIPLMGTRIIQCAILIPIQFICISGMSKFMMFYKNKGFA